MTKKIPLILFGGSSEERMVSVASAQNLSIHLPEAELWFMSPKGEVYSVSRSELAMHLNAFTTQFVPSTLPFAGSLDKTLDLLKDKIVILALHGTEGEDGGIQTILEINHIPFTGSGSSSSRMCFDKKLTKENAKLAHLPVADDLFVAKPQDELGQAALRKFFQHNPHMVLKPVANGSSVGLFIIHSSKEFESALSKLKTNLAGAYLAETFLEGREITVGVCQTENHGARALPCSEVELVKGRQFDYEGKYLGHGVRELTPAPISIEESQKCQELAVKMHKLMNCSGYSRTDMILTSKGPILLEINTLPGLSKASFLPQQVMANGENLRDFFLKQIEFAQERYRQKVT